jgi:hypothetical protein
MNRRPWPIVLLAILQFISPIIYLGIASIFYGLSFADTAREVYTLSTGLRKFEIFALPIILGVLILITRKLGYLVVIVGSVYLMVRCILEFLATNQTDPVFPMVFTNLICAIVLAYFMRSKTREIYFNPSVRWWETDPRYVVNIPATVTRIGAAGIPAKLENLANGGAGLHTAATGFLPEEVVDLSFTQDGTKYTFKARIVWQRQDPGGQNFLGVQWADETDPGERSKLRRLVREFKRKGLPTTRQIPTWWEDFRGWLTGKKV